MSPHHDAYTSWQHIWRLSWLIILPNITVPLVGVVDLAMMGRLNDPAFIGGVGLGIMVFNFMYLVSVYCVGAVAGAKTVQKGT